MQDSPTIELWRTAPPNLQSSGHGELFPLEFIFPSGRVAIGRALSQAGLTRAKRVACPEWSSHCLLSAVSRFATPVPMFEVLQAKLAVDAVLIYEQWGWPTPKHVWNLIKQRFPGAWLIWDRVDSADFLVRTDWPASEIVADFTSLSKLLGLPGGGILRVNRVYATYASQTVSNLTLRLLQLDQNLRSCSDYKEYFKNHEQALHPDALGWLQENSIAEALAEESVSRQHNLRLLLKTNLTAGWEPWMRQAVEDGASPGIAPLLRGATDSVIEKAALRLMSRHHIEGTNYHFNWTGDLLAPRYEPCLAFPVHGQVFDFEHALAMLQESA